MRAASGVMARIWRAARPFQWRLVRLANPTFLCGVTGVVQAGDGRVLLLRHRFWPTGRQWGFPGGYALAGERHEDTIVREVREETGLAVTVGRVLEVRSGYRHRVELYYEAFLDGSLEGLALDTREVLEARLFDPGNLPADLQPVHRRLAEAIRSGTGGVT